MHLDLATSPRCTRRTGAPVEMNLRDAALLAWLALEGPTPRARLAALLWPSSDAEAARNSLRQRLFQLRKNLGVEIVVGSATLALADGVTHDLEACDTVLGEAAGEDIAAGEFTQWLELQRARRRDRVRRALVELAGMAEQARDWDDALMHARELLALEPLSEEAHRRVMRLHYLAGDRAAALLAFDRCEQLLKDEVGARPSAETLALLALVEGSTPPAQAASRRAAPASLLRPPRLIGRDRELSALAEGLEQGHTVFVVGEAGMGKTRLLDALRQREPLWVYASARPGDAGVPFAAVARVLREVAARAATPSLLSIEPAQRRELARLLPEFEPSVPRVVAEGQRLALEQAVQTFLWAHGAVQGLLLDDLHFADRASLELLSAVLTSPREGRPPLRCALAFRPAEAGSPLVDLQDALIEQLNLVTVALTPLDESALAELIESLALPEVDSRAIAPAIHRRTGGNPMFVLETLKQAWSEGLLQRAVGDKGQRLPAPASIGRLIDRRLAQLSPAALALARVASVAGVDFEIALAEQVLSASAMQFADALNELEAAQVLRGNAFAHDLVFETVRAGIPAAVAVRTHAQVAAWLSERDGEPARLAEHWIAGEKPAQAIEPLREAARRSETRTAFAEAARFAQRAADLCAQVGHTDTEFDVVSDLVDYYSFDDPGAPCDAAIVRLTALARTDRQRLLTAVLRHNTARRRQHYAPPEQLLALIDDALRLDDKDSAATLVIICAGSQLSGGEPDAALALMTRHKALFEEKSASTDMGGLLGNLSAALARLDRFDEAIELAERSMAVERDAGANAELMRMMCNRTRYYRGQGRLQTTLAAFEEIDRWHAAAGPNPQAWSLARCSHADSLCDFERFTKALSEAEIELEMSLRAAGRLALARPVARAKNWIALGQPVRAMQALMGGEADFAPAPDWLQARWMLLRAQAEARLHSEYLERPGEGALTLLEHASRLAPRDRRRLSWFECELQRAAWSAPGDGAARAELVASLAQQQGMFGHALHARYRAAERLWADQRLPQAAHQITLARALQMRQFADATQAEPVFPCESSQAEVDLIEAQVGLAVAEAGAGDRLGAAARRLKAVAAQQVPPEFRDSFLHRNPVHRELLALAARLAQ